MSEKQPSDDDNDVFMPPPPEADASDPKLEPLNASDGEGGGEGGQETAANAMGEGGGGGEGRAASEAKETSSSNVLHRLTRVPVVFHDDGEVCPVSRGEKCSHSLGGDDGDGGGYRLSFADASDQEEYDALLRDGGKVENLRKLAGCFDVAQKLSRIMSVLPNGFNGVRIPNQGLSWDDGTPMAGTVDDLLPVNQTPFVPSPLQQQQGLIPPGYPLHLQHPQYLGVPSPMTMSADPFFNPIPAAAFATSSSVRADSGVGESIEGTTVTTTTSTGYFPPLIADDDDFDGMLEEGEDALQALPDAMDIRRYERKKRIGLSFLSSVNSQQLATLNPALKSSMDNFLSQLEASGFSVRKVYGPSITGQIVNSGLGCCFLISSISQMSAVKFCGLI